MYPIKEMFQDFDFLSSRKIGHGVQLVTMVM